MTERQGDWPELETPAESSESGTCSRKSITGSHSVERDIQDLAQSPQCPRQRTHPHHQRPHQRAPGTAMEPVVSMFRLRSSPSASLFFPCASRWTDLVQSHRPRLHSSSILYRRCRLLTTHVPRSTQSSSRRPSSATMDRCLFLNGGSPESKRTRRDVWVLVL
jgi:hypothetical protein